MDADATEGDRGRVPPPIVNKFLNAAPAVIDGRVGDVAPLDALTSAWMDDTLGPDTIVYELSADARAAAWERVNEDVGDDLEPSFGKLDCVGLSAPCGRAVEGVTGMGDSMT